MKRGLGLSNKEMGDVFAKWNTGVLDSFLIEITRDIMYKNDDDGTAIVEKIMDSAGQKGTGKWTAINALDLGMPVTLIGESVFARCLSSLKTERGRASGLLDGPSPSFTGDKQAFIDNLEQALYASKIISYAQGFMLIQNAAKEYGWKLNKPEIALMWRGGCIIRSVFLKDITNAYVSMQHTKGKTCTDCNLATARTPSSRTCCSTTSSTRLSTRPSLAGETSSPRALSGVSPCPPSALR
jgi:6-phosphogluconate dehydrogenase